MSDILDHLKGWIIAYPVDVFVPLTNEDREGHGMLITRNSADVARHFVEVYGKPAIAEMERLRNRLADAEVLLSHRQGDINKLTSQLADCRRELQA